MSGNVQMSSMKTLSSSSSSDYGSSSSSGYHALSTNPSSSSLRRRNNIISMSIIALCVIIGDMTRGVTFPTLWIYISSFNGNKEELGLAVASFSAGRIISSPVFGGMSERHGYRYVLVICCVITIIGSYIYASADSVEAIIIAQFVLGFGAGTLGVTRSYFAECSTKANRSIYMANLTSVQYFAFTVTPILGAVLSAYIENKQCTIAFHNASIAVNSFTIPVIFLSVLSILCIFLLCALFVDIRRWHGIDRERIPLNAIDSTSSSSQADTKLTDDTLWTVSYTHLTLPTKRIV